MMERSSGLLSAEGKPHFRVGAFAVVLDRPGGVLLGRRRDRDIWTLALPPPRIIARIDGVASGAAVRLVDTPDPENRV